MDSRRDRRKKAAFSNSSDSLWTRPQGDNVVMGSLIMKMQFFEMARMLGNFAYADSNMGNVNQMRRKQLV